MCLSSVRSCVCFFGISYCWTKNKLHVEESPAQIWKASSQVKTKGSVLGFLGVHNFQFPTDG